MTVLKVKGTKSGAVFNIIYFTSAKNEINLICNGGSILAYIYKRSGEKPDDWLAGKKPAIGAAAVLRALLHHGSNHSSCNAPTSYAGSSPYLHT